MVISPLWLFLFRVVSRQDGNCIKCPSTSPVPFGEVDPLIIDTNSRINLVLKSQVPTKYTNQPIKWMCFKAQHSKIFLCPILSTIFINFPQPKKSPYLHQAHCGSPWHAIRCHGTCCRARPAEWSDLPRQSASPPMRWPLASFLRPAAHLKLKLCPNISPGHGPDMTRHKLKD